MVIGFIVSSGHAIVVFKILPARRKAQKAVHLLLHLVALLAGVVGVYVAFKFKRESGLKDMSSLHSWFGMATICLYGLQWLLAFLFFWFPGAAMYTRARIVPWHVFAGLVIFLMAICAAELGILEKLTFLERAKAVRIFGEEALLVNFMGIAILFFAIAVGLCLFL
ncbi:probable ascorbate-specific transmembrane electron transporter 1 [Amborella trichopoda]|nr:probable ascorbate-specific transmembrane electron transporter 1 [Amborella trichopoda]|eukprot:XP_006828024.2 probable ascorbate-specific transmembrane electron transporter 1 [Amborella trichopoda]